MKTLRLLALLACSADNATGQNAGASAGEKPFKTSVIADFESPWAMTFLPDGRMLIDSYHCSRYNQNTNRLTAEMFEAVFARALELRQS